MSIQLVLRFDEVPITCEIQQRYHSIAPCLAGKQSAEEWANALGLSYSTLCRWLRQFREGGLPGLFPATGYLREPHTP
jgi:transposase